MKCHKCGWCTRRLEHASGECARRLVINTRDGSHQDEDDKEPVTLSLHPNAFDRLTGSDPSADLLDHSVLGNSSTSHNAALQEVTFPTSFIDSRGVPSQSSVDCGALKRKHIQTSCAFFGT